MKLPIHLLAISSLLSALASSARASSARLTVSIPSTNLLQNPNTLPSSTHATLQAHGPPYDAPLTRANTFVFSNLTQGSYLLTVHCRDYAFEPLRVDVTVDETGEERVAAWQTFRGNEWDNKGEKRGEGVGGVVAEVRPVAVKEYYQARSGFSILSFLKSPMILMALFSLVLIIGLPYMMESMDPETRAEFEEMQKQSPLTAATNPAAQFQNFDLAAWMAGKSSGAGEEQRGGSRRRG